MERSAGRRKSSAPATKNFYVVGKRLSFGKVVKLMSKDLLVMNLKFKTYTPFSPSNKNDFVKKVDYGRVENDNIALYWIIDMVETEAEREDIISSRVVNPKRQSVSPTELNLTQFAMHSEKFTVKENKAVVKHTTVESAAAASQQIVNRFLSTTNTKTTSKSEECSTKAERELTKKTEVEMQFLTGQDISCTAGEPPSKVPRMDIDGSNCTACNEKQTEIEALKEKILAVEKERDEARGETSGLKSMIESLQTTMKDMCSKIIA